MRPMKSDMVGCVGMTVMEFQERHRHKRQIDRISANLRKGQELGRQNDAVLEALDKQLRDSAKMWALLSDRIGSFR